MGAASSEGPQLFAKGVEDVGTPPFWTKDDLPAAASGNDEGACLVIKCIAVGIWAYRLGLVAVIAGLARVWIVVLARAAVPGVMGGRARREARVEDGSLDVVVWVREDAVARLRWRVYLEVPRAPVAYASIGLGDFVRHRVSVVGVGEASSRRLAQIARGCDAPAVGQVWRNPRRIVGGDVDDAQGQIVAVNKRDVVERLLALPAADEVELSQCGWNLTLCSNVSHFKLVSRLKHPG